MAIKLHVLVRMAGRNGLRKKARQERQPLSAHAILRVPENWAKGWQYFWQFARRNGPAIAR